MSPINFQFLRDCVTALKEGNPAYFDMAHWSKGDGFHEGNNWCGTPACVAGYWAAREVAQMPLNHRQRSGPWLFSQKIGQVTSGAFGLDEGQRCELFGAEGCGNAKTPRQAIAYIQDFILRHGGSIEDPKPLDVAIVPDWTTIAIEAQPVAHTPKVVA